MFKLSDDTFLPDSLKLIQSHLNYLWSQHAWSTANNLTLTSFKSKEVIIIPRPRHQFLSPLPLPKTTNPC